MPFDATPGGRTRTYCRFCPHRDCMARSAVEQCPASGGGPRPHVAAIGEGEKLFGAGDRQLFIYTVRSGWLKTFTVDVEGNERIHGFFLPGDTIGLDSLYGGIHWSGAAALSASQVCATPLSALRRMCRQQPQLAMKLQQQTSHHLALALALSGGFSTEQRLAAFLLHMRSRLGPDGTMRLPVGQREIGSYLRMASETVCRCLKTFERRGWLSLNHHAIDVLDERSLRELADAVGILGRRPAVDEAA